ncbi:hypothetical protein B0H14DRAFT_2692500, partial [Mycena olivaceomarginata]
LPLGFDFHHPTLDTNYGPTLVLILCLVVSNISCIIRGSHWLYKYLSELRQPGPRLVPYFDRQGGNVCLPFNPKPDDPDHKNPELEAIFSAAIPHVADILAAFDHNHPAIESFMQFFANKKTIDIHREAGDWMRSLYLVPTPELEAVLTEPLGNLLKHELLVDMLQPERHRGVMAVGFAPFQLLAVQHILGEELSLEGSCGHICCDTIIGSPQQEVGSTHAAVQRCPLVLRPQFLSLDLSPLEWSASGERTSSTGKKFIVFYSPT